MEKIPFLINYRKVSVSQVKAYNEKEEQRVAKRPKKKFIISKDSDAAAKEAAEELFGTSELHIEKLPNADQIPDFKVWTDWSINQEDPFFYHIWIM